MTSKLKDYFPMIRSREEILKEIQDNIKFTEKFYSWRESERQEFLDFCTGIRGVKILYDSFFKEIMNPETVPERLEDFLSVLLQRKVKIVDVLPGDSSRIADEQSLLSWTYWCGLKMALTVMWKCRKSDMHFRVSEAPAIHLICCYVNTKWRAARRRNISHIKM